MFFLKFNDFDKSSSNNDRIRVFSDKFIYNVTIGYDEKSKKRIVLMQDVSSLNVKKNDCIIEMDNLQGFIMQDFILFVQIDKKQTGVLNFKNWSTSSNLNAVQATDLTGNPSAGYEYKINIFSENSMLHFGELSFLMNSSKTVNKVNALNLGFYEKGIEKISIHDFELAVNSLDIANIDGASSETREILEALRKDLADAQSYVTVKNNEIQKLTSDNKIITQERDDLRTENTTLASTIQDQTLTIKSLNAQISTLLSGNISSNTKQISRYILSKPMQDYGFGNSVFFDCTLETNESYLESFKRANISTMFSTVDYIINETDSLVDKVSEESKGAIIKWWSDFESTFDVKKENLVIAEEENGTKKHIVTRDFQMPGTTNHGRKKIGTSGATVHYYRIFKLTIKKIEENSYNIFFAQGRNAHLITSENYTLKYNLGIEYNDMDKVTGSANFENAISNKGIYEQYHGCYFNIKNVKIKTDKVFAFENIEVSDYKDDKVTRFIEFEYDPSNLPKITHFYQGADSASNIVSSNFLGLYNILYKWIVN
jgi:hypothetical protein